MKFYKIVGFGDSWMYGDELIDPDLQNQTNPDCSSNQNTPYRLANCFLGQLGKKYHVPTENFGIPGGSLQSSMWTFQWWLDHEPYPERCLVLIGLPNSSRISHYDPNRVVYAHDPAWNKFVHSAWVHFDSNTVPQDFVDLIKQQIALTFCPALYDLNYQQAVIMFDGVAARRRIPMLQFNIVKSTRTVDHAPTLIWPDFSMVTWFQQMDNATRATMLKSRGHPNELGHTLIRDRLISQIDSCIITGC